MELVLKITYLALLVFGFAQSSVLPVEKCTLTDKTCMIQAVQKMLPVFMAGMPENGVELLDPMKMTDLKFDLSGLKFSLTNGTLKGLKNGTIEDVEWDTKKKLLTIPYHADISVKGHYTADGRVLILPITGDGDLKLKLKKLYVKYSIQFITVKKNNKEHFKPTKYFFEFEVKDGLHVHLTNLFNGNKELSDSLLSFVNDNWKEVSQEFGAPLVDNNAKTLLKNIAAFFDKQPIGEIANM